MGSYAAALPPPPPPQHFMELRRASLSAPHSSIRLRPPLLLLSLSAALRSAATRPGLRNAVVDPATVGPVDPDRVATLEKLLSVSPDHTPPSYLSLAGPTMMGGKHGAFGAVTLERSELDVSKQTKKSTPETELGGGDGNNGKINSLGGGQGGDGGGGGGGGGGGDDDDYFGDFDEEDEGDEGGLFRRRVVFQELFDRKFVDAVLQEWCKTAINLPAGLRQAYHLGLVSSAEMAQFLAMNARPTISRAIARSIPKWFSRAFTGRVIADPSFLYKLILRVTMSCTFSVWREFNNRHGRVKQEWPMALVNILTAMACTGIIVWSLAPCRSYGDTFRFDFQKAIQKIPNNIFEKNYRMREFDLQKRLYSFLYRAVEFSLLGLTVGSVRGVLSNLFSSNKEGRLSMAIHPVRINALRYSALLGLFANMSYQILNGADRALVNYFDDVRIALLISTALSTFNAHLGAASLPAWLGMEDNPPLLAAGPLKGYKGPPDAMESSTSEWSSISKDPATSARGLLRPKQRSDRPEATPSKTRRKRIVRKKVSAT